MDRAAALAQSLGTSLMALHVMDTPWLSKLAQPAWRSLQQDQLEQANKRLRADLANAPVNITVLVETGNPIEVIEQIAKQEQCSLIVSGTAREETLGRLVLGNTVERLARRTTTPLLVVRARPFAPYRKIVVAIDFSDGSRQALMAAHTLCADAQLTLYHAFDQVAGIYQLDQPTVTEEIAALIKKAKTFVQSTPGLDRELPIVVEHGSAQDTLPAYVRANDVELLVMGTHGETGVVRTAMGSVAEKLLTRAQCDVLIVPHTNH
ncbi:MAG: universal stress protein [Burkholderiaceae bacterium]|nr:universal stress protein [Burkholderiaceae bacterium]MCD8517808.1 universal stress protein [Burkholderiaceae bacterium]MCD8537234.1 universal stress protein [Burkholderiaceae bacterium]MCD8564650.1 universal stress protein [Burkholderiaceae bacterium]